MAKKFFTNFERMECVKKFRTFGLSLRRFAMMHGVNRETLRDWVNAYQDLEGKFIGLDFDSDEAGAITQPSYSQSSEPRLSMDWPHIATSNMF